MLRSERMIGISKNNAIVRFLLLRDNNVTDLKQNMTHACRSKLCDSVIEILMYQVCSIHINTHIHIYIHYTISAPAKEELGPVIRNLQTVNLNPIPLQVLLLRKL